MFEVMKHAHEDLQCYQIYLIDELIENDLKEENPSSQLEIFLVQSIKETREDDDDVEMN